MRFTCLIDSFILCCVSKAGTNSRRSKQGISVASASRIIYIIYHLISMKVPWTFITVSTFAFYLHRSSNHISTSQTHIMRIKWTMWTWIKIWESLIEQGMAFVKENILAINVFIVLCIFLSAVLMALSTRGASRDHPPPPSLSAQAEGHTLEMCAWETIKRPPSSAWIKISGTVDGNGVCGNELMGCGGGPWKGVCVGEALLSL